MRKYVERSGVRSYALTLVGSCCAILIAASLTQADDAALSSQPGQASVEGIELFEAHIRPVLVEKCFECHSADASIVQGGLRLDTADTLRTGGDSGPAVVPHKPDESLLLEALHYDSYEMPPSGKLPDVVIEHFAKWIALGAPDPREDDTPAKSKSGKNPDPAQHWAFQPPERVMPPAVQHEGTARTGIDRFVLAQLEATGLTLSPQAEARALLRRLYYDLIGLPPSAEELAAFATDPSDEQYEQIVDQLLASPRFGERWARHWLDVARYADTKGYVFQEDRDYKHAYLYRDWVIASFNNDLPFDEFIVAQIAADQLEDETCLPAMGFLTLGRRFLNNRHDIINDRIDVITRGLMGLSVACARCHDHKHDAISTADYYAMYGVLASSEEKPRDDCPPMLVDSAKPVDPVVFVRGNPSNRGPEVARRFITSLTPGQNPQPFEHGSGRREMAQAIASGENPLTARVWVNRVWGHLFGRGLVATPSDFGTHGMPPSHPQLLDWLACELVDNGWSTKSLIRQIVLSSTYRQSSDENARGTSADAENILLWRANRRRLDLESFRDSLLVAAERLDKTMAGPAVSLTDVPFTTRRAVYGFIERQNLPAFFRTFDFANPNTHTPERPQTTAPQQALFLMNSPFVIEQAIHLAARSAETGGAGDKPQASPQQKAKSNPSSNESTADRVHRISRLYQCALGREPAAEELTDALEFVELAEPANMQLIAAQQPWQFGWGAFDEATGTVQFQSFPSFTGSSWQGGATTPHAGLGWAMLSAGGGHPGDHAHQAVRRWIAPLAGSLHIEGVLSHPAKQGDGVRGRIVTSRGGLVGSWEVRQSEASTAPPPVEVQPGDTIDFITDCRQSVDFDSFQWIVTLRVRDENDTDQVWDSAEGFHGPAPLSRWQQLAQVLLMSNEFMFVD